MTRLGALLLTASFAAADTIMITGDTAKSTGATGQFTGTITYTFDANGPDLFIKFERREGDFARKYDKLVHGESAYFVWVNRRKQSAFIGKRCRNLALPRPALSVAPGARF